LSTGSSQLKLNSIKNSSSNPYLPSSRPLLLGYPHLQIFDLILPPKSKKPITQYIGNSSITSSPQNFLTTSPATQMGPRLAQKLTTHTLLKKPFIHIFRGTSSCLHMSLMSCHRSFPDPSSKFRLVIDSLSLLLEIQDTYSDNPIAQLIHVFFNSLTASFITVSLLWMPGHIGLPEHDAVDIAATEPLLHPTITYSSITLAHDLKTFYFI